MVEIFEAHEDTHLQQVRVLFREYFSHLPCHLCFANFEQEIENLPGEYGPPAGCLLLATVNEQPAGCVGLRPFRTVSRTCEMKRLCVRPDFRGQRIGLALTERLIEVARKREYRRLRLDTHPPTMQSAVALYRSLGFVPLTDVPDAVPSLLYMELDLTAARVPG